VQYVHGVSQVRTITRRHGFDVLIAVGALSAPLEVAIKRDPAIAPRTTLWFVVPAIAFVALPLFARRRYPFAAPASVWLVAAALSFVDGRLIPFAAGAYAAGLASAFLLGNLRDDQQARIGLAVAVSGALIVTYNNPRHEVGDLIFLPALFALVWLAGLALRERAAQAEAAEERARQAEREREASARVAVAEERARIARELHDIVAHSVSVMVLQVGAVRHNLPEALPGDKAALEGVERTGRTALVEMRRLLGAMRHDDEDLDLAPQPGLDSLGPLLEKVRLAGLSVRLQVEGEPLALPRALDLSAYRIVQEGLTNALKHARASQADVVVRYAAGELQIEVRDDGTGAPLSDGLGHGLVGVRERVKVYGGRMTAETASGGGFVLTTSFPIDGEPL
jgi:signal transduction histidine kinase